MSERSLDEDYNANGNEESDFEEVSFDEIEEKLNKEFESGGKPEFKVNTPATIDGIQLNRSKKPQKDTKGKEYYPVILRITCKVYDGPDILETSDNYGGLREYPNQFWNGKKSAFGKLLALAQGENAEIQTYRDLLRFLPKKEVKIRSEIVKYEGQEYAKNVITGFR